MRFPVYIPTRSVNVYSVKINRVSPTKKLVDQLWNLFQPFYSSKPEFPRHAIRCIGSKAMSSSCAGVHLPRHISLRAGERRGQGLSVTGSIWGGLLKRYPSINQNKESKVGTQGVKKKKSKNLKTKCCMFVIRKCWVGNSYYNILFKIYLDMVTSRRTAFFFGPSKLSQLNSSKAQVSKLRCADLPVAFCPGAKLRFGAVPLNLSAAFSCGGEVRPSGHPGQAWGPSLKKQRWGKRQVGHKVDLTYLDVPLEVSKRLVNGLYPTYTWCIPWGYNPLTNHLLNSRDIQVWGLSPFWSFELLGQSCRFVFLHIFGNKAKSPSWNCQFLSILCGCLLGEWGW